MEWYTITLYMYPVTDPSPPERVKDFTFKSSIGLVFRFKQDKYINTVGIALDWIFI